jgi:hypothetical protein
MGFKPSRKQTLAVWGMLFAPSADERAVSMIGGSPRHVVYLEEA